MFLRVDIFPLSIDKTWYNESHLVQHLWFFFTTKIVFPCLLQKVCEAAVCRCFIDVVGVRHACLVGL